MAKQGASRKISEKRDHSVVTTLEEVLGRKIRAKRKELAAWRATREEAAKSEDQCLREIAEMELALAVVRKALGIDGEVPPTDELDDLRLRSQTVAQSCFDMMTRAGGHGRVADLTKALIRAGKLKSKPSSYATVTKALDRDSRFEKAGRGEFRLAYTGHGDDR